MPPRNLYLGSTDPQFTVLLGHMMMNPESETVPFQGLQGGEQDVIWRRSEMLANTMENIEIRQRQRMPADHAPWNWASPDPYGRQVRAQQQPRPEYESSYHSSHSSSQLELRPESESVQNSSMQSSVQVISPVQRPPVAPQTPQEWKANFLSQIVAARNSEAQQELFTYQEEQFVQPNQQIRSEQVAPRSRIVATHTTLPNPQVERARQLTEMVAEFPKLRSRYRFTKRMNEYNTAQRTQNTGAQQQQVQQPWQNEGPGQQQFAPQNLAPRLPYTVFHPDRPLYALNRVPANHNEIHNEASDQFGNFANLGRIFGPQGNTLPQFAPHPIEPIVFEPQRSDDSGNDFPGEADLLGSDAPVSRHMYSRIVERSMHPQPLEPYVYPQPQPLEPSVSPWMVVPYVSPQPVAQYVSPRTVERDRLSGMLEKPQDRLSVERVRPAQQFDQNGSRHSSLGGYRAELEDSITNFTYRPEPGDRDLHQSMNNSGILNADGPQMNPGNEAVLLKRENQSPLDVRTGRSVTQQSQSSYYQYGRTNGRQLVPGPQAPVQPPVIQVQQQAFLLKREKQSALDTRTGLPVPTVLPVPMEYAPEGSSSNSSFHSHHSYI
ncbi:MAG: hypothetical protein KF874_11920 [Rhizobiaceae bacterium]|nr:hypothetical protein [Rhizobiaceae bacterium]